ncbi:MAG: hypothetical protein KatS3mg061_0391 [Dehalococcoidia bacterium]|nr:MAG: hypothetical protein KatS3mg061_0391 [Dehalococcoidia bacterium]
MTTIDCSRRGRQRVLAVGGLLLVTALWGSTFPITKGALTGIGPASFVAGRFLLAALVLALFTGQRWRYARPADWRAAGVLGGWLFGAYACQTLGLLTTTASQAGFLTGLSVVLAPLAGLRHAARLAERACYRRCHRWPRRALAA